MPSFRISADEDLGEETHTGNDFAVYHPWVPPNATESFSRYGTAEIIAYYDTY